MMVIIESGIIKKQIKRNNPNLRILLANQKRKSSHFMIKSYFDHTAISRCDHVSWILTFFK